MVYFDQNRELDPDLLLRRALAPDSDSVIYQDRVIHVASWAARFLFTGEDLNRRVGKLSGGERARVLIAQLMLQPADVLLLDEPTNDLDIPTLEILEESLLEFRGALVLVTHDRYMLDRVSTIVLGFDGLGGIERFADYSQWEAWQESQQEEMEQAKTSCTHFALHEPKSKHRCRFQRRRNSPTKSRANWRASSSASQKRSSSFMSDKRRYRILLSSATVHGFTTLLCSLTRRGRRWINSTHGGRNSNTRRGDASVIANMASVPSRRAPGLGFQLKYNCAEKDFLAHFRWPGCGGGLSAALLVGRICDDSRSLMQVGGWPIAATGSERRRTHQIFLLAF